jgi:hypothetical protein
MKKEFDLTETVKESSSDTKREMHNAGKLAERFLSKMNNYLGSLPGKIIKRILSQKRETVKIIEEGTDKLYLKACIVQYKTPVKKTKHLNSLYLWEAYRFARKKKLNIPDEFFEYLDRCSESVLKIESSKGDSGVRQLDDTFELRDKHFSQYQNNKKWIEAYIRVKMIKEKNKSKTMEECFEIVAQKFMGRKDDPNFKGAGTVRKQYYKINDKIAKESDYPTVLRENIISRKIR